MGTTAYKNQEILSSKNADGNIFIIDSSKLDIQNFSLGHYRLKQDKVEFGGLQFSTLLSFKEAVTFLKKGSPIHQFEDGELPFINPKSIRSLSLIVEDFGLTRINEIPPNAIQVKKNDIVINSISTYRGAAALINEDAQNLFVNKHVIVVRPNPEIVLPEYLLLILNSKVLSEQMRQISTGAVIRSLSLSRLQDMEIPILPMEDQLRLVERFQKFNKKLDSLRKEVAETENELSYFINNLGKE